MGSASTDSVHCGHRTDWNVHFGSKIGYWFIIAFLVEIWLVLAIFILTVRRRTQDRRYSDEQRAWLLEQVETELKIEEGEQLRWHEFPNHGLARQDAQLNGNRIVWDTPSGVTRVSPNVEGALYLFYFGSGHLLAIIFFTVWTHRFGECPWPMEIIITLVGSTVLGAVVLPFAIERWLHRMPRMVVYAITTRRAILLRSCWTTWQAKGSLDQELFSYHLNRRSDTVQVQKYRLIFECGREPDAEIDFMLIEDPQAAYDIVRSCKADALRSPPLAPTQTKPERKTRPVYDLKAKLAEGRAQGLPWYKGFPTAAAIESREPTPEPLPPLSLQSASTCDSSGSGGTVLSQPLLPSSSVETPDNEAGAFRGGKSAKLAWKSS